MPIIDSEGSDSAMFDNTLEFLHLSGRSLAHEVMMMVPEPWSKHETMNEQKRAFYEYHSALMEPWDGPAAMAFTDGQQIGAVLDRNGLRPSRYYITDDDLMILASEVGVLEVPEHKIVKKDRLYPGRMLLVDTKEGRIISDEELKMSIAAEHPYDEWLKEHLVALEELPDTDAEARICRLSQRQQAFGYTYEELVKLSSQWRRTDKKRLARWGWTPRWPSCRASRKTCLATSNNCLRK